MIENQRERLFAAMVATATTKGYAQTSVGDLSELSGVSSRTFYDLFGSKQACFLETVDAILLPAQAITAAKMNQAGSWEQRAIGAMQAFVTMLVTQPAAARLCLVEAYAAGAAATRRIDQAQEVFEELMQAAFEEHPERRGMPREMTAAMVSGLRKILHTRLHRGTEAEVGEFLPELLDLWLSYRPPPQPLRGPTRRRRSGTDANGEDAPRLPHHDEDPAERIIRATVTAIAANGYPGTTVGDIVEIAGASLNTFYAHFDNKEAAFDAALYSGRARMLGVLMPVFRRARNWPEGVRSLTQATLGFLASEPEFTQLLTVDIYAAGLTALERRDQGLEATMVAFEGGLRYGPSVSAVQREAIMSSLYAMVSDRAKRGDTANLRELAPLVTYMVLSPFIGAEAACEIANGGNWVEPGD